LLSGICSICWKIATFYLANCFNPLSKQAEYFIFSSIVFLSACKSIVCLSVTFAHAPCLRLRSHKHKYESDTVRTPVYEFWQTRVCVYFNGSRSHTYEYGLLVNFTRTSSFRAGRVFIQLVESKLLVNSINIIGKNRSAYLTSELTSS